MLALVKPALKWKAQAEALKWEHFAQGELCIHGSALWDQTADYAEWLDLVKKNSRPETVSPGWVPSDVFFALRSSDQKIVGMLDLRHTLNDFLKDLGHIGYTVLPSERRKGYASEMVRLLLKRALALGLSEVILSCEQGNEASRKTILKNGGVYSRSFVHENSLAEIYRISL